MIKKLLLIAALLPSVSFAQTSVADLAGMGMSPELANELGKGMKYSATSSVLCTDTSDAADNKTLYINGGGKETTTPNNRGANLTLYGNEVASTGGQLLINSGAVSTGGIIFSLGNTSSSYFLKSGSNVLWSMAASTGTLTQNATNGGSIVLSKANTSVAQPASSGLTAAGTAIGDALQLDKVYNNVTTAGAGTGVKLWNPSVGGTIWVRNGGANNLLLYPADASGTINGGAGGAAITLTTAAKQVAACAYVATNTWMCSVGTGT